MIRWIVLLQAVTLVISLCDNLLETDPETACSFPSIITVTNDKGETVDSHSCGIVKVNKTDWQSQPSLTFSEAKENATYTVVLIDPDVPNYPKGQYYLHWLMANTPGSAFKKGDTSKGNSLDGPAPPANSGYHRYMFIVFEESVYNQKISSPNGRSNFEFLKWLNSQDEELCGPVAGAEFLSAYSNTI